jgi:N-acyl-D-amino-acid deacylase
MGISNRGRIAEGYYADLVLFDPDTVIDRATMTEPMAMSSGIERVWVNGVLAFDDGASTGVFAGQVVSRPR